VSQPTPQRPTADKGRHGTGAEKNTWANGGRRDESARWQDARLTSISPVRFRFPPFPPPLPRVRTGHAHLTVTANPTSTRATQPERDPPHTASPLLGSPNFFFSSFFLSLSLSAKNRNSPIQTFSSLPRLAHRRRRCSTLLSSPPPPPPPPPPRQVKHRVVWPPLDRESRPRSLDDASRPPRPRFGRCRGSVSGVRVRVAGR
jgi:hypothetical protein